MSTALYIIFDGCMEKSHRILSHSCLWKQSRIYDENCGSFISKHFDNGCNYKNFRIIQEGDEEEENYKFDGEAENGIYTVTTVGDAVTPWVLTKSTDYDGPPLKKFNPFKPKE